MPKKVPRSSYRRQNSTLGEDAKNLEQQDTTQQPKIELYYNGIRLDVSEELVKFGLGGLSIKHKKGMCEGPGTEGRGDQSEGEEVWSGSESWSTNDTEITVLTVKSKLRKESEDREMNRSSIALTSCLSETNSLFNFDLEQSETEVHDATPSCMKDNINYRNSYWNLHKPELSKVTWPWEYVSTATMTDFLHNHLTQHGPVCAKFHTRAQRDAILDKELDNYDRLRELVKPRPLPTDDDIFIDSHVERSVTPTPSNIHGATEVSQATNLMQGSDEEAENSRSLYRSPEEFCITVGLPAKP